MNLLGLLGLLSLPVILLLHLLREREQRRMVSSLELWAWLKPAVRGPRPRRLPWNRVLALQLLAALFLTTALVNPPLPLPVPPPRAVRLIFVLDNSTSMSAVDAPPTRFGVAQAQAAARLAALGGDESAALITVSPAARRIADSAQTSLAALAADLSALQAAGVGHDWTGALALASASVVPGQDNRILVYTDGAFELPAGLDFHVAAAVEWNLIGEPQPNQAVVTLAARPAASGAQQVFTRVANFSLTPAQRLLTLLADGEAVDSSQLTLAPSGTASLIWTLPPGLRTVEVRLSNPDGLPADDRAALGLSDPPVDALLVSRGIDESNNRCHESNRTPLERALCAVPNIRLKTLHPETFVAYELHDLFVFQGWLPAAWPNGGVLVIDPPGDSPLLPRGEMGVITSTLPADALLSDVNFANVTFGHPVGIGAPGWLSPVFNDERGGVLIWRGVTSVARVIVLAFDLNAGNLTKRSAFPILVANAVSELLPAPLPPSISPGEAVTLPSAQVFPALTLTDPQGNRRTFGVERPSLFGDTARPGLYALQAITADGQSRTFGFGVNAGSPAESDLRLQARPQFSTLPGSPGAPPARGLPLVEAWPALVVVALALLLVETRVAWR